MSENSIIPLVKREPKPTLDDIEQKCYWLTLEILERSKAEKPKTEVKEVQA